MSILTISTPKTCQLYPIRVTDELKSSLLSSNPSCIYSLLLLLSELASCFIASRSISYGNKSPRWRAWLINTTNKLLRGWVSTRVLANSLKKCTRLIGIKFCTGIAPTSYSKEDFWINLRRFWFYLWMDSILSIFSISWIFWLIARINLSPSCITIPGTMTHCSFLPKKIRLFAD